MLSHPNVGGDLYVIDMTEQQTAAPFRVLPFDVDHVFEGVLGGLERSGMPPAPPTYLELEGAGLIAPVDDPDRWFSPAEARTAAWLRGRECPTLSVRRLEGRYRKTPDAVAAHVAVTIETKTADSTANAITQRVREGRKQARRWSSICAIKAPISTMPGPGLTWHSDATGCTSTRLCSSSRTTWQ